METIFIKSPKDIKRDISNLGLVLGYFDGVHIGHAQLINYAKSNTRKGSLGVLSFDRALKSIEGSLIDISDKEKEMEKLGVDYLFIIICTDQFKHLTYEEFTNSYLKAFSPAKLFCGADFKFGYGAKGDVSYLKSRFNEVYVLNYVLDHNENKVSSTNIKELIKEGNVEEADRYLGKPYKIKGGVIHGLNNGKIINFPTANLLPSTDYVIPSNGVYFTKAIIDDATYISVTNIGVHPTIDKLERPTIETFVIDYDGDLYGKSIGILFFKKERDEEQFGSLEELKNKIESDIINAEHYFKYKAK